MYSHIKKYLCIKEYRNAFDFYYYENQIYDVLRIDSKLNYSNSMVKNGYYWIDNWYFNIEEFNIHFLILEEWREQQIKSILDD